MEIRTLIQADLEDACRLSAQAGWNQLAADWRRLLALWPDSCLAGVEQGRLVATGTLAVFGRAVGWIGMILVEAEHRRRGLGARMFQAILDWGQEHGVELLGLDATDWGRPLYAKFGFVERRSINRWMLRSGEPTTRQGNSATRPINSADWPILMALDRQAAGVDRGPLLRHLAAEPGAKGRVHGVGRGISGFGFYRQGRLAGMIGPLVCNSAESAVRLLDDLLAEQAVELPAKPVLIDVPAHPWFEKVLEGRSFAIQRRLVRMVRPPSSGAVLDAESIYAAAGFELG